MLLLKRRLRKILQHLHPHQHLLPQLPTSIIEQELSAAKAQVQLLLDERNYLRAALEKEQSNTKTMAEQLATQDQRTATIIAALSQPKELTDTAGQKRGFWQRLFG